LLRFNPRFITFLICLGLSCLFWFVATFGKFYNSTLRFPIEYRNFPESKVIVNRLPNKLAVDIEATGFSILWYKFKSVLQPIVVDLKEMKTTAVEENAYVTLLTNSESIAGQLGTSIKLIKISPDTIRIRLSKKMEKDLPVKFVHHIELATGFEFTDSIRISPDVVHVKGPESLLKNLQFFPTQDLKIKHLDEPKAREIGLYLAEDSLHLIQTNPVVFKYNLPVSKFAKLVIAQPQIKGLNFATGWGPSLVNPLTLELYGPVSMINQLDKTKIYLVADFAKRLNKRRIKLEVVGLPNSVQVLNKNNLIVDFNSVMQ